MKRQIRLGIDVGGTFTKAVAVDIADGSLIGKITVHTTHESSKGVSEGIILSLTNLMNKYNIEKSEIDLISHSTTQAVNALLEGDTAKVGIIGMGVGIEKSNVIKRTNIGQIKLSSNKVLATYYRFLDTSEYLNENEIIDTIKSLKKDGAQVLVVSEAYGVDDPSNEQYVMERSDIPVTAGHELTGIYGLEIRTLTAAINAGIMPKSINTAKYVESAVRNEGITTPIMIMKGDGGVTDIETFKDKPITTVLSGPAASVAGALLHSNVLHGVFIEVGGTSTNISIIKNGKPEIRYVTIMDHPTCIRSIDVRVAGVAGGSLIRMKKNKIVDVGPRSAHIAGLKYSCFVEPEELKNARLTLFKPKDNDSDDYICLENEDKKRIAITNTCAANALEIIEKNNYAYGNTESAKIAFSKLGDLMGVKYDQAAKIVLDRSTEKIMQIMKPMIKEYNLSDKKITLIGGGGGASVLVPYISKILQTPHKIAENSEIVSSIGVAAAMIYEEIEKTVNETNPDDISKMTEQIKKKALDKGASPESLSIQSEYISERSVLRVTATGNVELDIEKNNRKEITQEEAKTLAEEILDKNDVRQILNMENYYGFSCEIIRKKIFKKTIETPIVILDKFGRIRLMIENAHIIQGTREIKDNIENIIMDLKDKNDLAPQIHILDDVKIMDFSSLTSKENLIGALNKELEKITYDNATIIIKK